MISFIIIGRNEGWKLTKCFNSVFETILVNKLTQYEVIFVDSKSTDDSIERVKAFPIVKIFQITGNYNAAIARNIGAKESKGDVLFYIDGDMEIQPLFLPLVYDEQNKLKHIFVSGQWIDYNYDFNGNLLSKGKYIESKYSDSKESTTGGLFLIERKTWFEINGMKNKMRRSQDLDLALRLAKKNIFLLRKKELLAIHHTVPYNDKKRMWKLLFSGASLYKVVLLKENFFNKYQWKLFLRGNYTFITLLLFLFLTFLTSNILFVIPYFLAVIGRTLLRKERSLQFVLINLVYFPVFELSLLFAFFFFWPKNYKEEYIAIN